MAAMRVAEAAVAGRENDVAGVLQSINCDGNTAHTLSSSATVVRSAEDLRKDQFRKEMEGRMEAKRLTKSKLGVLLANREIANTSNNNNGSSETASRDRPVPTKLKFAVPKKNAATTALASLPSGGNPVKIVSTASPLAGKKRSSDLDFLMQRVSSGAGPNLL